MEGEFTHKINTEDSQEPGARRYAVVSNATGHLLHSNEPSTSRLFALNLELMLISSCRPQESRSLVERVLKGEKEIDINQINRGTNPHAGRPRGSTPLWDRLTLDYHQKLQGNQSHEM
ncbi:nudC domain-containing protein 3 [Lates japonicus]|uniref:NudC domain-containing protein 3 n=1 Tax=Lates japonicus TaxID=270547 RepID=A0AAD3MKI4_LATJO|nr:nudC domain-containing protein 3 [Lates japonicus]